MKYGDLKKRLAHWAGKQVDEWVAAFDEGREPRTLRLPWESRKVKEGEQDRLPKGTVGDPSGS